MSPEIPTIPSQAPLTSSETPYRLYVIEQSGHIAHAPIDCQADNDADAVRKARQLQDGKDIEVWKGTRVVAYLASEERE
jgi:hypothetical protein